MTNQDTTVRHDRVKDDRAASSAVPFAQYAAIRRYQPTIAVSPTGDEVAYSTNVSGQFNIWTQPATGGYARQLTLFDDATVRQVEWSPDGQTLVFQADRAGDEFHRIYRVAATGGQPIELFGGERVRADLGTAAFSPDGRQVVISANDRQETDEDLVILDVNGGESGRPLADGHLNAPIAFSPDGRLLLYAEVRSNTDFDAGIVDLASGTARNMTPHDGEVMNDPAGWTADGSGFYLLTNQGGEFSRLALVDLASGEQRTLAVPDWDIEDVTSADGGRYLTYVVNENGISRLHVHDLGPGGSLPDGDGPLPVPSPVIGVPEGVISALTGARSAPVLAFLLATPTAAIEVYTLDLRDGRVTKLTDSVLGGIDPETMVNPELIHYPTHDGRHVPAWLYRPRGSGLFPVVLSIHGGPEAQERPLYGSGLYQYLLSHGIGILAPNVRGSTGYGKTYQTLIHRDWGGDELKDFRAAAEYLRGIDWVDGERLGVYGGSFGGFATLSCVSRLPDYWAAAVDIVGPSNLVTFATAVPPTWRRLMASWVGDPDTEQDFLLERSPITYVDQIRAPLFVIQGANDPRVVKPESDQIVQRLRERGVDVRYDVYEDEGHGFTRRENELKAYGDTAAFLVDHLLLA